MNTAQTNFRDALATAYAHLFATDPSYSYAASKMTAHGLADHMTEAAISGKANYDGPGFRMACRALGIKHTGKSIHAYLDPKRDPEVIPACCAR